MEKLSSQMSKRGMRIRTWGKSKSYTKKDLYILNQLSQGLTKGKRGRAKEIRNNLLKDGFQI